MSRPVVCGLFVASMWNLLFVSCVRGECVGPVVCELCLWQVCGNCSL